MRMQSLRFVLPLLIAAMAAAPTGASAWQLAQAQDGSRTNTPLPIPAPQPPAAAPAPQPAPNAAPSDRPETDLKRSRAFIGVQAINVSTAVARRRGVPGSHVVSIVQITPNGPAANAGMLLNDIVLRVDNVNTLTLTDVSAALNIVPHGQLVEIVVWRNRAEVSLRVQMIRLQLAPDPFANKKKR